MPAGLTDAQYRSLAEFRHQLRRFLAFSEARSREAGLEPQQHQLLLALRALAPESPSIGALAERLVLKHHSTVELVDRLEARGLVKRSRLADSRRQVALRLTARGERVLRRLSVSHRDQLRRGGRELIEALRRVLHPPPARRRRTHE